MTPEELNEIEKRRSKFDVPLLVAEIRHLWSQREASSTKAKAPAGERVALTPSDETETAVTKAGKATRTT